MNRPLARNSISAVMVAATFLAAGGVANAAATNPEDIFTISQPSGPPGTEVTVSYVDDAPKDWPDGVPAGTSYDIELYADQTDASASYNQAFLGTADPDAQGNFSTTVTIPTQGDFGPIEPGLFRIQVHQGGYVYGEQPFSVTNSAPTPPPEFDVANCRVDVRAATIPLIFLKPNRAQDERGLLNPDSYYYHLFAVYTDPTGAQYRYEAKAERLAPPTGIIDTRHGTTGLLSWSPWSKTVLSGPQACSRDNTGQAIGGFGYDPDDVDQNSPHACFIAKLDEIEAKKIPYEIPLEAAESFPAFVLEILGVKSADPPRNSNSVVYTILKQCEVPQKQPRPNLDDVPGWGVNLLPVLVDPVTPPAVA